MSLGSDSPGGSPEGIGGDESGIGGGGGGGGGSSSGFSGWGGGFASSYGGFDFGGGGFGFGDPGATSGFGDVGFGTGGTGYAGQGFLNADIAGISGLSPDISEALRALPAVDQENIFATVIAPQLNTFYGPMGKAGMALASKVFGAIASGFVPGLGTLASITGATGYLADKLQDMSFSQAVGEQLGIRNADAMSLMSEAEHKGLSGQDIIGAARTVSARRGEDMAIWDEIWGGITGSTAAGAATGAAQTQAQYQQQALDYLKGREQVPLEISGGALQQLGGLYGLPGGVGDQQAFINQARQSPLYGAIMGGRQAGEEGIMRQAGMTGGLRSGNVQEALYDYNTQLENRALMGAYGEQLGGLQYLARMQPGGAAQIANLTAGIGTTLAGGQTAAAQAQQTGTANLLGLGGALYQAAGGVSGIIDTAKDIYETVSGWF